jgi:hypothetical protein
MVLPMTAPCLIYLLIKNTLWSGLVFMILVVFATLFAIFLINAVYLFILRFTTPDRFKNIIGYVQIVFAVTIMAGYQILPRMMDWTEELHFSMTESWWYTLIPPYWFGVAFNTLTTGGDGMHWLTGALAFLLPIGSILLVVKYLAPSFVQRLAMISGADAGSSEKPVPTVAQSNGYSHFVANLVTRGSQERAGFLFTWKMMLRSREFKLKVYPSIGYMLLLIIGMVVRKGGASRMEADTFHPILVIYLSSFLLVNVLTQINYSEKYRASWMFFITPLEKPGLVISGAAKAAILQLFTLLAGICIVLAALLSGYKTLPNLGLALSNQLLINFLVAYFFAKDFPFSQSPATQAKGGQFVKALMLMVVSALIGLVHYLLFKHPVAIAIGWVVSISSIWLVIRALRNTPWKNQQIED